MDLLKSALAATVLVAATEGWSANRWGFGPLAGVNVAGADLGGPEDRGIMGWAIGGRVDYGMNRLLSLSTDPMFIRTGAEWNPADQGFEARGQFYRVEVPMFLKARVDLFNLGFYAFAGPNASFLWGASGQLDNGHALDNGEAAWGGVSGDIGIGSAFAVAPLLDVTADARYSHGLTDMLQSGAGEVERWQSRDVRVVLGVLLHGG